MSWIPKKPLAPGAATQVASRTADSRKHAHSLEMPIVMSVRRLPAPVYGTLMDITGTGARIRSLVLMERATEVEFDLGVGSSAPLTISAKVESRRNAPSGARFEYHVTFENMPESQLDVLARHVRELERRAAASRSIQRSLDAMPTTDRERRGSFRAMTAFAVGFRRPGEEWCEGRVGDISSTGIRMNCLQMLPIGTELDVRVTLPSSVLDVYPEETAVLDLSYGAPRRISSRPDMRRAFTEMTLRGRVVTRFQPVREREVYGVAFLEIDGFAREEIARFTHAVQLSKIRNA